MKSRSNPAGQAQIAPAIARVARSRRERRPSSRRPIRRSTPDWPWKSAPLRPARQARRPGYWHPTACRCWSAICRHASPWVTAITVRPSCGPPCRGCGCRSSSSDLAVEARGRLVEDQDRRAVQQGAGERDALALAAGDHLAALADHMVQPVRQGFDELVGARRAQRPPDVLVAEPLLAQRDVVADGVVEQGDVLRHIADAPAAIWRGRPRCCRRRPASSLPERGGSRPMMRSSVVVLPTPDGPTRVVILPGATVKSTFDSSSRPSACLNETPSNRTPAAGSGGSLPVSCSWLATAASTRFLAELSQTCAVMRRCTATLHEAEGVDQPHQQDRGQQQLVAAEMEQRCCRPSSPAPCRSR